MDFFDPGMQPVRRGGSGLERRGRRTGPEGRAEGTTPGTPLNRQPAGCRPEYSSAPTLVYNLSSETKNNE